MILKGSQRGGAKALALHLLNDDNEQVEVHEVRGFASENLLSALNEVYAISKGTRAKQFLFSLSLNPPDEENVSTAVFEDAIERIEQKLGLTDQPRAIVFHEKKGRRHCHAVWSRIDAAEMKAIPLSYFKKKLMNVGRALYREHGWRMPAGMVDTSQRDPRNFTLPEWQQAKRVGKDPKAIKAAFQECWAASDSQTAFRTALKERGYTLARGDRRGVVALDYLGEVYSVAKYTGNRANAVLAKITEPDSLPSVTEARAAIAQDMAGHLNELQGHQDTIINARLADIEQTRERMAEKHKEERTTLEKRQEECRRQETRLRQERYRKGLRGWLDRLTGHRRRVKQRNEEEAKAALQRDREEQDALIFRHLEERRPLQRRIERLRRFAEKSRDALTRDISQYDEIRDHKRETVDFRPRKARRRDDGPTRGR